MHVTIFLLLKKWKVASPRGNSGSLLGSGLCSSGSRRFSQHAAILHQLGLAEQLQIVRCLTMAVLHAMLGKCQWPQQWPWVEEIIPDLNTAPHLTQITQHCCVKPRGHAKRYLSMALQREFGFLHASLNSANGVNPIQNVCARLLFGFGWFCSPCFADPVMGSLRQWLSLHLPALLVCLAVGFSSLPLESAARRQQEKGELKQPAIRRHSYHHTF